MACTFRVRAHLEAVADRRGGVCGIHGSWADLASHPTHVWLLGVLFAYADETVKALAVRFARLAKCAWSGNANKQAHQKSHEHAEQQGGNIV